MGEIDRRRVAFAHHEAHAPAVEDRAGPVARIGGGAEPGHAPAPAVPSNGNAVPVHARLRGEQVEGGVEVEPRPVVAKLRALRLDVAALRPPVADERYGDRVTVLAVALGDPERDRVVLEFITIRRSGPCGRR
jgi:hypothetical protein